MKSKCQSAALFSLFVLFIIAQSCNKENENENSGTKISSNGSNESHNMGKNCMSCHNGWFNVAGTVYGISKTSTYPNATVKLYTGPNETGTLKYTIMADAKGNFYTTENIDFGNGLYPSVKGTLVNNMQSMITSGACNSCHNVTNDKIWTN